MYAIPQDVFLLVVGVPWIGGGLLFFARAAAKQRAYLKHFPPVEGISLDTYTAGNPFGTVSRAIWRVMLQPQMNPELERLRREAWRWEIYQLLWTFLFPVFAVGVAALLIATGIVLPT